MCSSSGGQNCIIQHLVPSHSVDGRPVHRLRVDSALNFQALSRLSSEVHSINYRKGENPLHSFNEWNYRKRQWYHITQYEDALQVYLQLFDQSSHSYPLDVTTIVQFLHTDCSISRAMLFTNCNALLQLTQEGTPLSSRIPEDLNLNFSSSSKAGTVGLVPHLQSTCRGTLGPERHGSL